MTIFSKVTLITFIAQVGYLLLAAFAFGKGQYLLHDVTAIVAGLYLTKRLRQQYRFPVWLVPLAWLLLAVACYWLLWSHMWLISKPSDYLFGNNTAWNILWPIELLVVSVIIGLVVTRISRHRR